MLFSFNAGECLGPQLGFMAEGSGNNTEKPKHMLTFKN
jgi:hypothetical protein